MYLFKKPSPIVKMLNETVKCTLRPSTHGVGVFAIRDIKKGEVLTDYTYQDLNKKKEFIFLERDQFMLINKNIREVILDRVLYEKDTPILAFLHPNEDAYLMTFMNHSATPNSNGEVALCDIKKGEEVTFDYHYSRMYRFEYTDQFDKLTLEHMPFLK